MFSEVIILRLTVHAILMTKDGILMKYLQYKKNNRWFKHLKDIKQTKPIRASIQGLESNLVDTVVVDSVQ